MLVRNQTIALLIYFVVVLSSTICSRFASAELIKDILLFDEQRDLSPEKQTLCLSMIVRNEAHVIRRLLLSVIPVIDCWFISDTGSTDGTQEIIQEMLQNIPGELSTDEWVDFSTNRNLILNRVRGDYALVIDADEELIIPPNYQLPELMADCYTIEMDTNGYRYEMIHIMKTNLGWNYVGVVHEYLTTERTTTAIKLEGVLIVRRQEGNRSLDPNTYRNDASLLLREYHQDPTNPRTVFYLAQSYRDAGEGSEAIFWYRQRAKMMNGFDQERWYAQYQVARLTSKNENHGYDVLREFILAHELDPSRPESLFYMAKYLVENRTRFQFWHFSALLLDHLRQSKSHMFSIHSIHPPLYYDPSILDFQVDLERAVVAYYQNDHRLAISLNLQLLNNPNFDRQFRSLVETNLAFSMAHQSSLSITKNDQPYRQSKDGCKIALSITTLNRPREFRKTFLSFLTMIEDFDVISQFWAIDDGSSEKNLREMQKYSPDFLDWKIKKPNVYGHANSMNIILELAESNNIEYLVHLEDDWQFIKSGQLISKAIRILQHDENLGQVLFNERYAETPKDLEILTGGFLKVTDQGDDYLLHEYYPLNSPANERFWQEKGRNAVLANIHWPHFALRPGVWRMSAFKNIGSFHSVPNFENEYALRYVQKGYKTAFLVGIHCLHIGKLLFDPYHSEEEIKATFQQCGATYYQQQENSYEATNRDR